MRYMTFGQQVAQHLLFLQQTGLEVTNLTIDSSEFIRSRANGELGRGEYAYRTVSRTLNNGMTGLMTWCRSENGQIKTYKTYGYSTDVFERQKQSVSISPKHPQETKGEPCLEKIQKFWELSSQYGVSDYLTRKGVGSYRIRFRENQYGKVAIVPIADIQSKLCGYQILNTNGSKVFAKGMRLDGAFHRLTKLTDDSVIGIAESYVTAATCLELVGMPMVTAFSSNNLEHVAMALHERYPKSPLVIFADNDTHLGMNKGMVIAEKALERVNRRGLVLAPQFTNCLQGREYSDWNDLVRERGRLCAIEQIVEGLRQTQDDRIERFCIQLSELLNF